MNEFALKERLKHIAKEKKITFNEIWKQFLLERFLVRLSRSKYQEKFIFKGGLLLAKYIFIGRETTDVDFMLRKFRREAGSIKSAITEIISVGVNDGFQFEWGSLEELTQPHMAYPGFRINIKISFGKMKDKIQIDLGAGDLVDPLEKNMHLFKYKGKPIFEDEITLMVYPVATIFAEKLETIISKGAINSRIKDYHDVLLLIREKNLIKNNDISTVIRATFIHRGTVLKLPIKFDVTGMENLQKLWTNHLITLGTFHQQLNLPDEIALVLEEINAYLINTVLNE